MSFSKHTILDFFLVFFFGIKLPNRVPLNHPINEAATKTLTFSVILFELPSEHCACSPEFIGFAEPMSPLRFMHTHSYLLIIPCTDSLAILLRLRPPTGMSSSDATAISSTSSSSSEDTSTRPSSPMMSRWKTRRNHAIPCSASTAATPEQGGSTSKASTDRQNSAHSLH